MMSPNTKEAYQLLHDGILALAEAESHGLKIDVKYIQKQKKKISKEIILLENKIYNSAFYKDWKKSAKKEPNIYSSQQLGNYLYKVKGVKIKKETATGEGSTDKETLRLLNIPELETLLEIKELKKVRDTYLDQFEREQVNGEIHPFYHLHIAQTYRGSSSNPNFQNVPKRDKKAMQITRRAIKPRPGHQFLELDYSQLEVRIGACYSKDKKLIDDILHGDMHRDVAIDLFKIKNFDKSKPGHSTLRGAAKNGFVFPQFYGDYYENCAVNLAQNWCKLPKGKFKKGQGIEIEKGYTIADHFIDNGIKSYRKFVATVQEAEHNFWNVRYKTHTKWKESIWRDYQSNGFITSKTGFTFQGIMKKNFVINYPVQSAAFHCLLWSLIEGTKALKREKMDSVIVGQIHDAIVFDVNPKELNKLIKIMNCIMCNDVRQYWPWIIVPLEIGAEICPVDGSWADKQELNIGDE